MVTPISVVKPVPLFLVLIEFGMSFMVALGFLALSQFQSLRRLSGPA